MLKIIIVLMLFTFAASVFAQNEEVNAANVKSFADALGRRDFPSAYNLFADELKTKLPPAQLPQVWAQIESIYGKYQGLKGIGKTDGKNIVAAFEFANKPESFIFVFDAQGKITGFTVAPPQAQTVRYQTPNYADLNSFEEKEVTVGAGEWALPATLTMPKGKTNVSAIVLVHGSGPNDRDETIGGGKVFKDLAWGLASRGIAVLRYEKRTRAHGAQFVALKNYTVKEETIDDALLAVELLEKTANINPKKVFVLGHSLGGYLIPRIGAHDKTIAGLISLAGSTRPLEDLILEQSNYLSSLDGAVSPEEKEEIRKIEKNVALVKSLKQTDLNSGKTYFGISPSYFLDLQNYNPPLEAKKLSQPMLILQGESDYQVTLKDFTNWKTALQTRKNVVFKSYPKLTHAFTESAGEKSSPQDYENPAHVNQQVVSDIADWILKMK